MAIDFTIAHLFLPAVCETPLFGFHEITSKVGDGVRATLPPSTLFADKALLRREYFISEPNTLVETVSKYKGLH